MTNIPASMQAIIINGKGGPEVLELRQMLVPAVGPGQILIKVAASGVNRPDVLQRKGLYPAPKGHSELPGLEVAGSVAAVGSGVTRFKEGDRVMALTNGGGYAAYCLADEGVTLPIPAGMNDATAAAIPETFFTVWHNVFERGALKSGEWFVIHGGTSGIGRRAGADLFRLHLQRLQSRIFCFLIRLAGYCAVIIGKQTVRICKTSVCESVIRVFVNGLIKISDGFIQVVFRAFVPEIATFNILVKCLRAVSVTLCQTLFFVTAKF